MPGYLIKIRCAIQLMDSEIIRKAFAFGGWVHGEWIRDKHILGTEYTSLDICFSCKSDVETFIKTLSGAHVTSDVENDHGCYMYSSIYRKIVLYVDSIRVDISVYDGTFEEWLNEKIVGLSCNLFYMSPKVLLGIRYIPDFLKHDSCPVATLFEMVQRKEFVPLKIIKKKVINRMVDRGWNCIKC